MTDGMEHLPIDIHYSKLLDWLISRRHCSKEWQRATITIREKINSAIQDMPEVEEVVKLLEGTHVNYFHCLQIIQLLKDAESENKKNIFGQYSSQRFKDWADIVKQYEKDGVGLGEVAQMLARNVTYEIPALKRQIAKCQQIQTECARKEMEYTRQSTELRVKYKASCKQMGIEGNKIKSELAALVKDLPLEYKKLATSVKDLQPAINYYRHFISFLVKKENFVVESVPVLKYVIDNGDVSTYEWRTGKAPHRVEESSIQIDTTDEVDANEEADDIDWGGEGEQIDFGDDVDIDSADISDINVENLAIEVTDVDGAIDYGDIVDEENKDTTVNVSDGVARGMDALSILDNPETRTEFINDVLELQSFLMQRLKEMTGNDSNVLSGSQFQKAPLETQLDASTVQSMLDKVETFTEKLTSVRMQHLFLIRNSPRYVERLKDNLKQTLNLADKMLFYQKGVIDKRNDALEEQARLEPELDTFAKKTKDMQRQMQGEVSKKYNNRPVNIMGEINTI